MVLDDPLRQPTEGTQLPAPSALTPPVGLAGAAKPN